MRCTAMLIALVFISCFFAPCIYAAIEPAGMLLYPTANNQVTYSENEKKYSLAYTVEDTTVEYQIHLNKITIRHGNLQFRLLVDGISTFTPIYESGFIIVDATGTPFAPRQRDKEISLHTASHRLENNRIHLQQSEKFADKSLVQEFIIGMQGKTLIVEASATLHHDATNNFAGFLFGKTSFLDEPRIHFLPSIPLPVIQTHQSLFASLYLDPFKSTTGRYETLYDPVTDNSVEANNTPAYMLPNKDGKIASMHTIGYITVSKSLVDVLPVIPANPHPHPLAQSIQNSMILDFHENLFAQAGFTKVIRRWDAPDSGMVKLDGSLVLNANKKAMFEVHYHQTARNRDHILFSQILTPDQKPQTGISGEFPVSEGDRLDFITYSPAVMTGGEVQFAVQIEQHENEYHSTFDFSGSQGKNQWYYEYESQAGRSLMLWNPERSRWEHPASRSHQTANALISRAGMEGDAYTHAERFFDSLAKLDVSNYIAILHDWDAHTRIVPLPHANREETVWGSQEAFQRVTRAITDNGNQLAQFISLNKQEKEDSKDTLLALRQKAIEGKQKAPYAMTVLDQTPLLSPDSDYFLFPADQPSAYPTSKDAWKRIHAYLQDFSSAIDMPLLLTGDETLDRADVFLSSYMDGVFSPILDNSNARNIVNEEVLIGRKNSIRIGLGTYNQFIEADKNNITDIRLFPLDLYWTTTVAYGRVPYFSDDFWHPTLSIRDIRMTLVEFANLLLPVAREYRTATNEIERLRYFLESGTPLTSEEVLSQKKEKEATRIEIEYANGLTILANRSASKWKADATSTFFIDKDGFQASNPKTGLFSVLADRGNQRFSACALPNSLFLNSRTGSLITFRTLATDGMIKLTTNATLGAPKLFCLNASEIRHSDLSPILLSNSRIDAIMEWKQAETFEIEILEAPNHTTMLEWYALPETWFIQPDKILVQSIKPNSERETNRYWKIIEHNGMAGIRFPRIKTGDILRLSFQN
jgi:hypothetical protein